MAKKVRTAIPADVADEVLFAQDHTCCVCRERGKPVQIHHINSDPSDHRMENLAVLCLHDHDRTMQRGGFGRVLTEGEVTRYRDDWLRRVAQRYERNEGGNLVPPEPGYKPMPSALLLPLIGSLPEMRKSIHRTAHNGWDTGVTTSMNEATYSAIDATQEIWLLLARWFPPDHFDLTPADHYVRAFLAGRFLWYRALYQPEGEGTAGTIIGQLAGGGVLIDIEKMVADTVEALYFAFQLDDLDLPEWRKQWEAASEVG